MMGHLSPSIKNLMVIVLLGGLVFVEGLGEEPAHVQSQYGEQLVTSSTLAWVRAGAGVAAPPGAVSAGTGKGLVCRGTKHGVKVVGATNTMGRCQVVLSSRLERLTEYQVLRQVPHSSKLEWKTFSRFDQLPPGAVAGVEGEEARFVAKWLDHRGLMWPAILERGESPGDRRILVSGNYQVTEASDCDLLVEVEPVRYELKEVKYTKEPAIKSTKKVLASTSIFRFGEGQQEEARMQKMVSYDYRKSFYISGHIPGTIRGLPGLLNLPSGERKEVQWGMSEVLAQREAVMVGLPMGRHTAVDVTVTAESVTEEQPFVGSLVSVFPDGSQRERQVEAVIQRKRLDNIKPEYSEAKAIRQQVVVEADTEALEGKARQQKLQQEVTRERKERGGGEGGRRLSLASQPLPPQHSRASFDTVSPVLLFLLLLTMTWECNSGWQ